MLSFPFSLEKKCSCVKVHWLETEFLQKGKPMRKNVWILNHYATHMFFDRGGRHYNFAKYLKLAGYTPVVFCANTVHNQDKTVEIPAGELWIEKTVDGIPFVFVRTTPYRGNGFARILNMVNFARHVIPAAKQYAKKYGRPDVIMGSSVHPLTLVAGIRIAKFFKVPVISEIRDLWPEALLSYGILSAKNPFTKLLYHGEYWIYFHSDRLIFTKEGCKDYILERKWDLQQHHGKIDLRNVYYINNGVDLPAFQKNAETIRYDDPELDSKDTFKVGYCGSIRRVNNVGRILDAAKLIRDPRIRFLIFGDGDERERLEQRCREEGIGNVFFREKVGKGCVPGIIKRTDLNLDLISHLGNDVLRFGGSQNKFFEYLAAGRPILTNVRQGYSLIEKYQCGREVFDPDPAAVARAIEEYASMPPEQYARECENARKAAEDFDFRRLTRQLIEVIESIEDKQ